MISQMQGLRAFVLTQLSDVMEWSAHIREDLPAYPLKADRTPDVTGDQAFILITTPFNRYRMSICSNYIEPPMGAPLACRSLGTVTFHDLAENKQIIGPKADQTWTDISKHIHVRELTDALAAARRESAESGPPTRDVHGNVIDDPAQRAHKKLVEVAASAARWGIAANVPELQASSIVPENHAFTAPPASEPKTSPAILAPPPSGDAPWLGAPVLFITNPGEQISGMQEIVGWCVKIISHDRISVFMTPDHSEPSYRDNLPRRGSPAGNGKVHQFNCWDFNPQAMQARDRIKVLEDRIAAIEAPNSKMGEGESGKRRGRPPKTDEPEKTEPAKEPELIPNG